MWLSGKTHAAVGAAAAMAVCAPAGILKAAVVCIVGAVGALLPDIDTRGSYASRTFKKCIGVSFVFAACLVCLSVGLRLIGAGVSVPVWLLQLPSGVLLFSGFAVFCVFGYEQPHRGFTHSLLAAVWVVTYSLAFDSLVRGDVWFGFAAGYVSHVIVDLLNKRGEQLFWPASKRYCLGLCTADGAVSWIMQGIAVLLIVVLYLV